jgi:divalent metal cation (Fe/Co/Zn/Cd) transporter
MIVTQAERQQAVRRATLLNRLTIAWNAVEGIVAIAVGLAAGSISLIGFGLDSGIEVSAALVLAWRLNNERNDGCQQPADDRARQLIAVGFAALALYVGSTAVIDLVTADRPEASLAGIAIAALSLAIMPILAAQKRRQAVLLGSRAAEAEAAQTDVCTMLSAALLVGLAANAAFGWWWADPVAGLFIAGVSGLMAYRTATAEALADTCCA